MLALLRLMKTWPKTMTETQVVEAQPSTLSSGPAQTASIPASGCANGAAPSFMTQALPRVKRNAEANEDGVVQARKRNKVASNPTKAAVDEEPHSGDEEQGDHNAEEAGTASGASPEVLDALLQPVVGCLCTTDVAEDPASTSEAADGVNNHKDPPADHCNQEHETDENMAVSTYLTPDPSPSTVNQLTQVQHAHRHDHVPEASEHEDEESEEEYYEFDPLLFIKNLPSVEQCVSPYRAVILPRKTRQCKPKTLVLDLDETLVHSSLEAVSSCDFSFPVHFNNQEHIIQVRQRPHLNYFMQWVAERFEVVVFTASQKIYAEKLLNIIDPQRNLIKHRIYRESCVVYEGNYLKDLSILGRDLRSTVIVDNSPQAFGFQVDNGVPIESWYDDQKDQELLKLLPFLESLIDVDDVRPHISKQFRLREMIAKAGT